MGKIIQNYSLQHQLGSGVYSRVFKAINLKNKEQVAIKMVKADKFRQLPKLQEGTINQINILSNLEPCPHIIKYYDMLKTVNNFYFVYQFCNGGTLQNVLKKSGALSQTQALIYFKQIVDAFKVLNKHNIMHRDLKPENILLNNGVLKIADFGFCKVLQNPDQMAQTMLGSPIYMAPQILKGDAYTIKADVWSLGVILFRMLFGYCPFQSTNIAKLILMLDNQQLKVPNEPKVNPLIINLIRRMLVKDAKKRADWGQVFTYEILENGTLIKHQRLLKDSGLGTSTSSTNTVQYPLTSDLYNRNYFHSSVRQMKGSKGSQFQGKGSQIQKNNQRDFENENKGSYIGSQISQSSQNDSRTRSPLRQKSNKLENLTKNHTKCIQINALSIQVAAYSSLSAICISFILSKRVQNQLRSIYQSIKKQTNQSQEIQYLSMIKLVSQQLSQLKKLIEIYKNQIYGYKANLNLNNLEDDKKHHLKDFIKNLQLESRQQLVMASRLIDFIQESLLIRRQTYQKLSKEQLQRQINNNSKFKNDL